MLAPPVAAASSDMHPPCLSAFEQPTEKALDSESTLSQLCFPNEFPYEFASSAFTSLEAEDDTNDEEDDFLAGLSRRLALFTQRLPSPPPPPIHNAKVNSPESTLSGLGSCGNKSPNGPFSQTHSPPETPVCEKDSLKIKVSNFDAKPNNSRPNPKPNNSFAPFPQNAAFYNYNYYCWLRHSQAALVTYQYPVTGVFAAPTAVKQQQQSQAALVTYHYPVGGVFAAPTAVVNQPSAGTGVFFPLKGTNSSRSRKKEGKCVKFPAEVVQTQPPKTEKLSGRIQSRSQGCLSIGRSKLDRGTKSSVVTGGCPKEERQLPKEWVY